MRFQPSGSARAGRRRLEEAVAAYREALKERTRERVPLDWAATQNNLGNALRTLGERESGTAQARRGRRRLSRGAEGTDPRARAARLGRDPEQSRQCACSLGERESGTARLEEAVAAYREALKEWTRERVPLDWAVTQNNLGNALATLGERESGTARLEEAVAAYREALKERTRERVPLEWATTQNNLGNALQRLGERESGTARLEEAVAAYREALKEWTRERVPLQWATSFGNEGIALMLLAERRRDAAMAETALSQINTAFETMRDGGDAPSAEYYEQQLPRARASGRATGRSMRFVMKPCGFIADRHRQVPVLPTCRSASSAGSSSAGAFGQACERVRHSRCWCTAIINLTPPHRDLFHRTGAAAAPRRRAGARAPAEAAAWPRIARRLSAPCTRTRLKAFGSSSSAACVGTFHKVCGKVPAAVYRGIPIPLK